MKKYTARGGAGVKWRRTVLTIICFVSAFAASGIALKNTGDSLTSVKRPLLSDFVEKKGNEASGHARGIREPVREKLAPLPLVLPAPAFVGTPPDMPLSEHLEKPSDKPRPPFLAPAGVVNVAAGKKVTSSDLSPLAGSLDLITDGDKEAGDTSYVELHRKLQWVEIDLESSHSICAIVVWHAHNTPQVYRDVVVQVSDDVDFTRNVRTLFNNDYDNSSGLGIGLDKEYLENYEGRLIDAKGVTARFVRLYCKGSTFSALNRYTEVEVYGSTHPQSAKN